MYANEGKLTINAHATKLRPPSGLLHLPSSPLASLAEISVRYPTMLIDYPRLLATRHEVEMRHEHVLVVEAEDLG